MKCLNTIVRKLTFDDLGEWAGEKVLNRAKGYVKRVDQLSCTPDNTLVAWVTGSERYATSVLIGDKGGIEGFCTCPYDWGPCKHAVAVILAASECIKRKEKIPLLDEDHDLLEAVFEDSEEDNEWIDEEWGEIDPESASTTRHPKTQARIAKILDGKSREELLDLLTDLSGRFPDIRQRIVEAEQLASGRVDKLTRTLRSEIRELTAEPAWYNPWHGDRRLYGRRHGGVAPVLPVAARAIAVGNRPFVGGRIFPVGLPG